MPPFPEPPPDFSDVLTAAKRGDEGAWRAIYDWLAPQVLGFLRARRSPDPEDVLGDVFLDVAGRIHRFRGDRRAFRAWVFTIARARRVDGIRRRTRRNEVSIDEDVTLHPVSPVEVEKEALAMVGLETCSNFSTISPKPRPK